MWHPFTKQGQQPVLNLSWLHSNSYGGSFRENLRTNCPWERSLGATKERERQTNREKKKYDNQTNENMTERQADRKIERMVCNIYKT